MSLKTKASIRVPPEIHREVLGEDLAHVVGGEVMPVPIPHVGSWVGPAEGSLHSQVLVSFSRQLSFSWGLSADTHR